MKYKRLSAVFVLSIVVNNIACTYLVVKMGAEQKQASEEENLAHHNNETVGHWRALPGVVPCLDGGLQNVHNFGVMQANGWRFHVTHYCCPSNNPINVNYGRCGTTTFWGFYSGQNGWAAARFKGAGTGTISFGECHGGNARAFLNNVQIGHASANQLAVVVPFNYRPGDELKLQEDAGGIVKINYLRLACAYPQPHYYPHRHPYYHRRYKYPYFSG